ncbi:MAG TPA: NAD-dependent epimerase/dehydratase family protein [Chryseolinea sp.]|nr:NAD-dependent epimerase/dehydratase family protein [Chryseolinea sp.]
MGIKIIITGATGFVGEGVLLECLAHPQVEAVLIVNRKHYDLTHPKLTECLVPDFMNLDAVAEQLTGHNACFYCAGVSSVGMDEKSYSHITYDITIHFAKRLATLNPGMVFTFVSGSHTDSSEKGRIMWARVKGKTENSLQSLPFRSQYNFRPGFMKPMPGQKNVKGLYRFISGIYPLLKLLFPNQGSTVREVGLAMINAVLKGYPNHILEVKDIKALAKYDMDDGASASATANSRS